jgi:2-methylaconitate cis-trans-isomerase PrpF
MFPTGNLVDDLEVPGVGTLKATMINAGIPTIFVNAEAIGYTGTELQDAINGDPKALAMFETIRATAPAHGPDQTSTKPPRASTRRRWRSWRSRRLRGIERQDRHAGDVDLLVRALSMGKLHHAMMGTAAVAIGTAAAFPGTLVNLAAGGGEREAVRFGHPSGCAWARRPPVDGEWTVTKAIMSRSAR